MPGSTYGPVAAGKLKRFKKLGPVNCPPREQCSIRQVQGNYTPSSRPPEGKQAGQEVKSHGVGLPGRGKMTKGEGYNIRDFLKFLSPLLLSSSLFRSTFLLDHPPEPQTQYDQIEATPSPHIQPCFLSPLFCITPPFSPSAWCQTSTLLSTLPYALLRPRDSFCSHCHCPSSSPQRPLLRFAQVGVPKPPPTLLFSQPRDVMCEHSLSLPLFPWLDGSFEHPSSVG